MGRNVISRCVPLRDCLKAEVLDLIQMNCYFMEKDFVFPNPCATF
jgi:hypothetical protein